MEYRKEIDGLRAFAIIPVIFFHAGISFFSGGYVGVDIFFVISGYLITSIIISEMGSSSFSLLKFYERRARRILPALFFMMIVTIPFAFLYLLPNELKDFGQSLVATSIFSSNILFWIESDYFDVLSELKPLLHTWSLAVEEQFYLFFPILLIFLYKFKKEKNLLLIVVLLFFISLSIAHFGNIYFPTANFYLLPSRFWEILSGSIVAIMMANNPKIKNTLFADIMSVLGFSMIMLAILQFDEKTPFPSLYTLIPVIGTVLIIVFAKENNLIGSILSTKIFINVGLISYSLYLWHQPIFAFYKIIFFKKELDIIVTFILISLSILMAVFSYKFIEKPFRKKNNNFNQKTIFKYSIVSIFFFTALGSIIHVNDGFNNRFSSKERQIIDQINIVIPKPCDGSDESFNRCVNSVDSNWALIGDSFAMPLADPLVGVVDDVLFLYMGGCPPIRKFKRYDKHESINNKCIKHNNKIYEYLKERDSPENIIVSAFWNQYLIEEGFDNRAGAKKVNPARAYINENNLKFNQNDEQRIKNIVLQIYKDINYLLMLDKKIFILYDHPEMGWDVPRHLLQELQKDNDLDDLYGAVNHEVIIERSAYVNEAFEELGEAKNLKLIKVSDYVCSINETESCLAHLNGIPLYKNSTHLSNMGASLIINNLLEDLQN